ncbi:MAG TPA: hypothetical protein VJZ26_19225 [Blastocatellia bacterium]|nr:hypothetical protein [Blastocatellia bacterium]
MTKTGKNKSTPAKRSDKLIGRYKQVRVVFVGASFLMPEGTAKPKDLDDAFGLFVLDEVFSRQSILSKLKGVLRKTHHCRKCDADLMGLKAHRRRFSLDMKYKALPSFQLEIEMPAIPCRKCGTSNAVNEQTTEFIISGAIANAFQSVKGAR